MLTDAQDNPENHQNDEKHDNTGEPNRTDEDDLLFHAVLTEKSHPANRPKDAELRGAIPGQSASA